MRLHVEVAGERRLVTVETVSPDGSRLVLIWDDTSYEVDVSRLRPGALSLIVPAAGHSSYEVTCSETAAGDLLLGLGARRVRARVTGGRSRSTGAAERAESGEQRVASPMRGRVVRVLVESGDTVTAGQGLAVVEAMKMENEVASPAAGVVSAVNVAAGDLVEVGAVLIVVSTHVESHD